MKKKLLTIVVSLILCLSSTTVCFASQSSYSTPDKTTYGCVKYGNYIYTTAGMEKRGGKFQARIYKIHYKTGKKTVVYTPNNTKEYDLHIGSFSIANDYLYFDCGTPQYDDPKHPSYIYRMSLKTKKTEKVIRGSLYYIKNNKIYAYYYDGEYTNLYYNCCNLDGTDVKYLSHNDVFDDYLSNVKYKSCNVKGYKLVGKTNKKTWNTKEYLKLKNGKKVFIANRPFYG